LIGAQLILLGTEYEINGDVNVEAASAMASAMGTDASGEELRAAGSLYMSLNYAAFLLPLVGSVWFLHYFCNKDSLGKRKRLVWAMNNMMIYCVAVVLIHIYVMTGVFGGAGLTVSLEVILYNIIMCLFFWWWRQNVLRFYRDWDSSNYLPTNITDAAKQGQR